MAWTTPTSRSTGTLITASIWNTDLVDNLILLKTSIADDGRVSGELKNFREELGLGIIAGTTWTINLGTCNNFYTLLGGNIATISLSGWVSSKSQTAILRFQQDGTGGRTVAFPAGWKWAGGSVPTVTATANKTDIFSLYSDDGGTTIFAAIFTQNA